MQDRTTAQEPTSRGSDRGQARRSPPGTGARSHSLRRVLAALCSVAALAGTGGVSHAWTLPALTITHADLAVLEDGGNTSACLSLSPVGDQAITGQFRTGDGTAVAPYDHADRDINVTFSAQEASECVDIPIVNDIIVERAETFRVRVSGNTPQTITVGDNDKPRAPEDLAATPADVQSTSGVSVSVELSPGRHLPWDQALTGTVTLDHGSYSSVVFRADVAGHENSTSMCFGDDTGRDIEVGVDATRESLAIQVFKPCTHATGGIGGTYDYVLDLSVSRAGPVPGDRTELASAREHFLLTRFLQAGDTWLPAPEPAAAAWMDPDPRTVDWVAHGEWTQFRFRSNVLLYTEDHLGVRGFGSVAGYFATARPDLPPEQACMDDHRWDLNWRRAIHQDLWIVACQPGEATIHLRHETDSVAPLYSYEITTRASPGTNNAPQFPEAETGVRRVAENLPAGTRVGVPVAAVDTDADTLTYTLEGADAGSFDIVASSGQLLTTAELDFEDRSSFSVTVIATDPSLDADSVDVTIRVTNIDEDGTLLLSPARPQVDIPISAALADPDGEIRNIVWRWEQSPNRRDWIPIDGANTASYIPAGADAGQYLQAVATYDDNEGPTKVAAARTTSSVVDPTRPPPPPPPPPPPSPPPPRRGGGPTGGGPALLPEGSNQPPTFTEGSRTMRTAAENTPEGVDIGTPVAATDPEGDFLTYKLVGTDADAFGLDPSSGQLRTKAALDYETNNSYRVTVEARDSKNPEGEADRRRDDTIAVTVNIADRDDTGHLTLSAPTPRSGQPLTAVLVDPDGVANVSWVWERSADRTTWTPIPDATSATYTPDADDEGHHLRVVVSYGDPFGSGKTVAATPDAAVTIGHTTVFSDVAAEGTHTAPIEALGADGTFVDTGCGDGLFCPQDPIRRWTMAVWLIRVLGAEAPVVGVSRFDDIADSQWWIRHVEQLADREITAGCATGPPRYCPDQPVTRAQMATLLVRAFQLPPAQSPAGFGGIEGNLHAANIDALAAAGVTAGCSTDPLLHCPDDPVTRAQMAAFLHRALTHQPKPDPTTGASPRSGPFTRDGPAMAI